MYFNNSYVYLIVALAINTCLFGLGRDYGVYFVQDDNIQISSK